MEHSDKNVARQMRAAELQARLEQLEADLTKTHTYHLELLRLQEQVIETGLRLSCQIGQVDTELKEIGPVDLDYLEP